MASVIRLQAARALAAQALTSGGRASSLSLYEWDLSQGCQSPVIVRKEGRADTRKGERGLTLEVLLETRCRRCAWCLRRRAWEWRVRADLEIAQARRTWFGTLTLNPERHYWVQCAATVRLHGRGVAFEQLSASEQFAERHRQISYLFTAWLKRIRKESGARLRFCLVAEAHKSGLPHYHILVHETCEAAVTKRTLQGQWPYGFTNFKLVEGGETPARYVTKYLSKQVMARVRASLHYGQDALDRIAPSEARCVTTTPPKQD